MPEGKASESKGKTPEEVKLFVDSLTGGEHAVFRVMVHLNITKSKNCQTETIAKHLSGKDRKYTSHIKRILKDLSTKNLIYRYRPNVWCLTDFGMKISHYIRDQIIKQNIQRTGITKTLKRG